MGQSRTIRARVAGVVVVAGAALVMAVAPVASAATAVTNVNFKGSWTVKGGTGFVIKTENLETGACTGTTDFGSPYKLVACKVHAKTYKFTITDGPSYKSFNSGTITGNSLKGSFHDTNGSTGSYAATRP